MSNRIGGDFNQEVVDAFRAAYAQQLQTPDETDTDSLTGLPTNIVSNTSPWIEKTGLWKYPSGRGPEEDLKTHFDPNSYLSQEEEDERLSDEEIDDLVEEVLNGDG